MMNYGIPFEYNAVPHCFGMTLVFLIDLPLCFREKIVLEVPKQWTNDPLLPEKLHFASIK